tara:strand:+ start:254 stop:475 length:222 start_codon:yes stop_codon:yes gene_type:complete
MEDWDDWTYEDKDFDESLPYISLDLDIKDIKLIHECITQAKDLCHHDEKKKENLKYFDDFFTRVILEYGFRVN